MLLFLVCQAFLDDFCATAAESLLKHVLLRAKGRVALRRLGSSAASSHHRDDHDHLVELRSSMSSPISCKGKHDYGDKVEDTVVIVPKSAAESLDAGNDTTKSDTSYDDEDDAFDDSNIDDGDMEHALSTATPTPANKPTILPTAESPTASAVPPINSLAGSVGDSTATAVPPPGSSLSGDVPNADPTQRRDHRQQQQLQQQMEQQVSAVLATPSPTHKGITTTPRTSPLSWVSVRSARGGSTRDCDVSTQENDQVAHPTSGNGKHDCGAETGNLRKQALPLSARR